VGVFNRNAHNWRRVALLSVALLACWFVRTNTARAATTLYWSAPCTSGTCGWSLTDEHSWIDHIDWVIGNNTNPEFTFHWSSAGIAACGGSGFAPSVGYSFLGTSGQLQLGEQYYRDATTEIYDMRYNSTPQTFTSYYFQLSCINLATLSLTGSSDGGIWTGTAPFSVDTWIHPTPSVYVSPTPNISIASSTSPYAVVTLGVGPMEVNGLSACGSHVLQEGDRVVPLWIEWEDITRPSSAFASTTNIGSCSSPNTYGYYPQCQDTSLNWWSQFAVAGVSTTTIGNTPVQFTIPQSGWPSGGIGGIRIHMGVLSASTTISTCDTSWFDTQWPLTSTYQSMFDLLGQNTSSSLYTSSTLFASSTFGNDAMNSLMDQLKYRGPGGYWNRFNEALNQYVFSRIAYQGLTTSTAEMTVNIMGHNDTLFSPAAANSVIDLASTKVRAFSPFPLALMFILAIIDFFLWWLAVFATEK